MSAPILIEPNWSLPFEMMFDASGVVLGAVLGQRNSKLFHPINYTSMILNCVLRN